MRTGAMFASVKRSCYPPRGMIRRIAATGFCGLAFLLALFMTACSPVKSKRDAENLAVPHFHAQYNASRFTEIYNEATKDFRSATKKEEYDQFMAAVRRKLGAVKTTESRTWNVNVTPAGTQISLSYKTEFENGSGLEQFTWLDNGQGPKLMGYNINSNTLITK